MHKFEEDEAEDEQHEPEQQTARQAKEHRDHAEHDLRQEHVDASLESEFAMFAS